MDEAKFKKALYYAAREDFNADTTPGYFIDKKFDGLIREAIETVENEGFPVEKISMIEVICLARAANRRQQPRLPLRKSDKRGRDRGR